MATQTKVVGTGANVTGVGSKAWTSPSAITAIGGGLAYVTNATAILTNWLQGTMSGNLFTIPTGSTINTVTVNVCKSRQPSASTIYDETVKLIKGGTVSGNNKGLTSTNWVLGTLTVATYAYTPAQWGVTLSAADVNASNFGVAFQADINGGVGSLTASVDYIEIVIDYTEPTPVTSSYVFWPQ